MNICIITSEYIYQQSNAGGLARFSYNLAQSLTNKGHMVTVITSGNKSKSISHNNLVYIQAKIPANLQLLANLITFFQIPLTVESLLSAIAIKFSYQKAILQGGKFDAIHVSSYRYPGKFISEKKVLRLSSYEPLWAQKNQEEITLDKKIMHILEDYEIKSAHKVYAPSQFLASYVERKLRRKVSLIRPPHPAPISGRKKKSTLPKALKNKRYFLYFGSICPLKGSHILEKTIIEVVSRTGCHFVLVGSGEWKVKHPKVIRLQAMDREELQPIIKKALAVVLPSLVDNLPNTAIETMELGRPIVSTYNSSVDELVRDGIEGLLFNKNKPQELVQALIKVSKMSKLQIDKMGKQANIRLHSLLGSNESVDKLLSFLS